MNKNLSSQKLSKGNARKAYDDFIAYFSTASIDTRPIWTLSTGSILHSADNGMYGNNNNDFSNAYIYGYFDEDQFAEAEIRGLSANSSNHFQGVSVRNSGLNFYYFAHDNFSDQIFLGEHLNGLNLETQVDRSLSVNDKLRLEVEGTGSQTNLKCFINGQIVINKTPTYIINAGNPGLSFWDNHINARMSNFSCGELKQKTQPQRALAFDDFEAYPGNFNLHTRPNWFQTTGTAPAWTWNTAGNVGIYGGGDGIVSYTGAAFPSNQVAEIEVLAVGNYWHAVGVSVRGQTSGPESGNGYYLVWNPADAAKYFYLGYYKDGGYANIDRRVFNFASGDKYRLKVSGEGVNTRLSTDINTGLGWEPVHIDMDPTGMYLDGGAPGIVGSAGTITARWDNFYAYGLPNTQRSLELDPEKYPLQNITGEASAYSFSHLVRNSTGNIIKVRREVDGAEKNIGADANGNLNIGSLLKHVGTGNGFVSTIYDQGPSGNHLYQSTASSQPRIVTSGVVERDSAGFPAAYFDGSNDFLSSSFSVLSGFAKYSLVGFSDASGITDAESVILSITHTTSDTTYHSISFTGYSGKGITRHSGSWLGTGFPALASKTAHERTMLAYMYNQIDFGYANKTIYFNDSVDGRDRNDITFPITNSTAIGCLNRLNRDSYYRGHISDAYIFRRPLSQGEITEIYQKGKDKYPIKDDYNSFIYLSGAALTTPDSPLNSITGDIDIRIKVALDSYTPSASQNLISKRTTAGQYTFLYYLLAGSNTRVRFQLSEDGTNEETPFIIASEKTSGDPYWFRVHTHFESGVIAFYSADSYNPETQYGNWTLESSGSTNYTSLFDSTSQIQIGDFNGKLYYAEIRDGVSGPIAAKFNASQYNISGTPNVVGETDWLINNYNVKTSKQNKILDAVPGAEFALGLVELSSGYSGPLVQARNEVNDIRDFYQGRYPGQLNSVRGGHGIEITDWMGTGHAYVQTWYDQSNNHNHAFQSGDLSLQPMIGASGQLITDNRGFPVLYSPPEDAKVISGNHISALDGSPTMALSIWTYEDSNSKLNGNDYWVGYFSQIGAASGPGNTFGVELIKNGDQNAPFFSIRNGKNNEYVVENGGSSLPSGRWNLLAASFNGPAAADLDESKVYVNSSKIAVSAAGWGSQPWVPNTIGTCTEPFIIFKDYTGSVGEVICWDRQLEQNEQNLLWGHYNR